MSGFRSRPGFTVGMVSGGHFLSHFYLLVFPPLFPFILGDFDLTTTQLGLIISVLYLATFVCQIPAGMLVDEIGAKRVFVLGVALTSLGIALVGVTTTYLAILALALLSGVGQSAFHPADYALLDAVTLDTNEGKSFGIHTFAGYAGFAVAPVVTTTLAFATDWRFALLATGLFGLGYAVVSQVTMSPVYLERMDDIDRSGTDTIRQPSIHTFLKPAILAMFAFFFVVAIATTGVQTYTTIFLVQGFDYSEVAGNTSLTAYMTLAALGVLLGGVLADRFVARTVIVFTLSAAGVVTLATVTDVLALGVGVAITLFGAIGFFYGLALPSRDRLVNAFSEDDATGRSFGFVYTGLPLGGVVAPILIGGVIDYVAVALSFVIIAIFYLLSALIVVTLGRSPIGSLLHTWRCNSR